MQENGLIETIQANGKTAKIYVDEDPADPREWDNLGTMLCFHKRYALGDKTDLRSADFDGWKEVKEYLEKELDAAVILPLYLLDHSGITMRCGANFSDCDPGRWDSGQVGFIYATRKAIGIEYGHIDNETIKKARQVLYDEVKTYDQYLTGDIYGYAVVEKSKCGECGHTEEIVKDSCWGFYGIDDVRECAKEAVGN